jgi:hypothetical protein
LLHAAAEGVDGANVVRCLGVGTDFPGRGVTKEEMEAIGDAVKGIACGWIS